LNISLIFMKTLKLKKRIGLIRSMSYDVLVKNGYTTSVLWPEMLSGGHGELVEAIVWMIFTKNDRYKNLKRRDKADAWDLELKNDKTVRVDIRRISKDFTINLGHTSGNLSDHDWQKKAETLNNGGYLAVHLQPSGLSIYYLPAKLLLQSRIKTGNNISVSRLKTRFGGFNISVDEGVTA